VLRLAAIALLANLSGGVGAGAQPATAVVVSWNLQGASPGDRAHVAALGARISTLRPDFIAVQECEDCAGVLPASHRLVGASEAGVGLAYDVRRWELLADGVLPLGVNDDGWGPRVARWGRFVQIGGHESVVVYSTHWCVPVRSATDACTAAQQVGYARQMVSHARLVGGAAPVVIAGDLNVFDGFQRSAAIRYLTHPDSGFDLADPGAAVPTFAGNDFASGGRIDYVLVRGAEITGAPPLALDPRLSDHAPVVADLALAEP
jgi:endonuclease/exonuclease/phosphatase family metal-dependent hydrolase